MVVSWVGLRVAMVPIIRHTQKSIIALLHSKTVTYSHLGHACPTPSIGEACHGMSLLRRMDIAYTGIAVTRFEPSAAGLQ